MKYKLINEDIKNKGLLEVIYENRGITVEQAERLLNANSSEYLNPFMIFNMEKVVAHFKKTYSKDLVIGLLPDDDVDGMTSSSLLYQWLINDLKHPTENVKVFLHTKAKTHGLNTTIFNDMLNSNVDLFLIADSSSNDKEKQKELAENGKSVIILD